MNSEEKEITYKTSNSYSTLNTMNQNTINVWFVCHGMGYLSRYFLKYFVNLDPEENYIIAPQAQAKYYMPPKFKHVGASWLTKENTIAETENIMRYFDAVFDAEKLPKDVKLIVLGYSQGVSVALRYVAKRQLNCSQIVLMSGGIPKELKVDDFKFLNERTDVRFIYGTNDEYIDDIRLKEETSRFYDLFGGDAEIISFKGKHMVNVELVNKLVL